MAPDRHYFVSVFMNNLDCSVYMLRKDEFMLCFVFLSCVDSAYGKSLSRQPLCTIRLFIVGHAINRRIKKIFYTSKRRYLGHKSMRYLGILTYLREVAGPSTLFEDFPN